MKNCMSCGTEVPSDMKTSLCPECYEQPIGQALLFNPGVEPNNDSIKIIAFANDDFNNILVRQKDQILETLNAAQTESSCFALITALSMLDNLEELWCAATYGYKYVEILNRVQEALDTYTDTLENIMPKLAVQRRINVMKTRIVENPERYTV